MCIFCLPKSPTEKGAVMYSLAFLSVATGFDPSGGGGFPPPQQAPYPGQQFFHDPMANLAMQYGTTLADQGKEYVNKNVSCNQTSVEPCLQ